MGRGKQGMDWEFAIDTQTLLCVKRASQVALVIKNLPANAKDIRDVGLIPWIWIPWSRKWQPTPVFLPGEPHKQGSLVSYSPQGRKELDTTEETQHALVK